MASQVSKLNYVDGKLGAPTSGQQTTRIVYNTQDGTAGGVLEFFKSFQGQSLGQTNLTQSKLDSNESMVIKSLYFAQYATSLNAIYPLALGHSCVVSVVVGNQTIIKDLPVHFNSGYTAQAFDRLHTNGGQINSASVMAQPNALYHGPTEVRLLTDIVIPPQTDFYVRLESVAGAFDNGVIICALSGYGKIFSAGSSF